MSNIAASVRARLLNVSKAQGVDFKSAASMADAWSATLQSYEKIFGTKPPMDIWGQGPAAENPWMQAMANWRKMFGMG